MRDPNPNCLYSFIATTNRSSVQLDSVPKVDSLDEVSDNRLEMTHSTLLLHPLLHIRDASAPLLDRDMRATVHGLSLSHARVDINILQLDVEWAICWPLEPAIALPAQE